MTISSLPLLNDQSAGVADSYWMCGDGILLNTLPARWTGLCTIVRMKLPVKLVYSGVNEIIKLTATQGNIHGSKRKYETDSKVYLDGIHQPRGIPEEFKTIN